MSLLVNQSYVAANGELPADFPLRHLPYQSFPGSEQVIERMGRLINFPKMDRWSPGADWYYTPMEGRLPTRTGRNATTIHDVQALEDNLPWSGTSEHRRFRRKWQAWLPKALRTVDRILTVSEFSKGRMIELLGADPDKIEVVGNAIDDHFFDAGAKLIGNVEKQPEVVVVGGLRYKKGATWVLEVAEHLQRMGSDLKIVVIGQHDEGYLRRAEGISRLEPLGMVDDAELIQRLSRARAHMLLSHYEGFGIPALEAMAVGTPSVVSNRASLPEVVGDAGIVVNPEKTADVAELLDSLMPGSSDYQDQVKRGRLHAQGFNWDVCVDRLQAIFSQ